MKAELDARKNDAEANEQAARECADAREAVFDFFDDDVIPDTERAADEAHDRREDLLEELDKAEVVQQAAKDQRDELAGVDAEKDKTRCDEYVKMRDEYEKNALAYREAEARLAKFKRTHGDNIDRYAERLVAYYRSEQLGVFLLAFCLTTPASAQVSFSADKLALERTDRVHFQWDVKDVPPLCLSSVISSAWSFCASQRYDAS